MYDLRLAGWRVNEAVEAEGLISCERRIHSGASESRKSSPQPERLDEAAEAEGFISRERRIHSGASE